MDLLEQRHLLERVPTPPHTDRESFEDRARQIGLNVSRGRQITFENTPYVRKRRGVRAFIVRFASRL